MSKKIFKDKCKVAVAAIFNEIEDEEKKDLFAFGLCTDNDISTLMVCYNTFSCFADSMRDEFLRRTQGEIYSEKNLLPTDSRWNMPEWWAEVSDHAMLGELGEMLRNVIGPEEMATADFDDVKHNLLDLLASVLLELREEGLFEGLNKNFFIMLNETDSGYSLRDQERVKKLIGERYFADFIFDMQKQGLIYEFN